MLTSRRFSAARATCSSATSRRVLPLGPASTRTSENRAEPVDVRALRPIITKFVSSVIANGSEPRYKRVTGAGSRNWAARRRLIALVLGWQRSRELWSGRRAAAAADDVHQTVGCELAEHAARVRAACSSVQAETRSEDLRFG